MTGDLSPKLKFDVEGKYSNLVVTEDEDKEELAERRASILLA